MPTLPERRLRMNNRQRTFTIVLLGLMFLQLCDPSSLWACPTCKDGLSNDTALGYAISILFMMGMPFLILSFWTVTIVRLRRLAAQSIDQP